MDRDRVEREGEGRGHMKSHQIKSNHITNST
jgi:hypothetical protein